MPVRSLSLSPTVQHSQLELTHSPRPTSPARRSAASSTVTRPRSSPSRRRTARSSLRARTAPRPTRPSRRAPSRCRCSRTGGRPSRSSRRTRCSERRARGRSARTAGRSEGAVAVALVCAGEGGGSDGETELEGLLGSTGAKEVRRRLCPRGSACSPLAGADSRALVSLAGPDLLSVHCIACSATRTAHSPRANPATSSARGSARRTGAGELRVSGASCYEMVSRSSGTVL